MYKMVMMMSLRCSIRRAATRCTCSEFTKCPSPTSFLLAVVAHAADPAFHAPSPDGFLVTLPADEARADVELLTDEAGFASVGRANTTGVAAGDAFVILEVVETGEGILVFIQFGGRPKVVGRASGLEPFHLDGIEDHAPFILHFTWFGDL